MKIEIPLFHVLNARITFGNIFSLEQPVAGVTAINDEAATACVVDESVFDPPATYSVRGLCTATVVVLLFIALGLFVCLCPCPVKDGIYAKPKRRPPRRRVQVTHTRAERGRRQSRDNVFSFNTLLTKINKLRK